MAHWGFLFRNLLIAWIMKVTLFDFIRGTTEDTSTAYWATPAQRTGRWAHLTELNFEGLHYTISHFSWKYRKLAHKCWDAQCLSGYKHLSVMSGKLPSETSLKTWISNSASALAQICGKMLIFFPEWNSPVIFSLVCFASKTVSTKLWAWNNK